MKINQKGFSPVFIVAAVIVILGIGGGFYYVNSRNNDMEMNNAVAEVADDTIANGTPSNAVKAVSEQISTEIIAEDEAMKIEEEATKLEDSVIEDLKEAGNEANL